MIKSKNIQDTEYQKWITEVTSRFPQKVADYRAGKHNSVRFKYLNVL